MTERRLIVSGTRAALSAADRDLVLGTVAEYVADGWALGVGDCPTGVDELIRETWPDAHVEYADWDRLGNAAGPERNGRLGAWGAAVEVAALAAFPCTQSRGTWDCFEKWKRVRETRPELGLIVQAVGR